MSDPIKGPMCDQCPYYTNKKKAIKFNKLYTVVNATQKIYPKKIFFVYKKLDNVDYVVRYIGKQYDDIEVVLVPMTHCLKTAAKGAVTTCWQSPQLAAVKSQLANNLLVFVGADPAKIASIILDDDSIGAIEPTILYAIKGTFVYVTGTFAQLQFNREILDQFMSAVNYWYTADTSKITLSESLVPANKTDANTRVNDIVTDQAAVLTKLLSMLDDPNKPPIVFDLETADLAAMTMTTEFWQPAAQPILMSFTDDGKTGYVALLNSLLFDTSDIVVNRIKTVLLQLFNQPDRTFVNHNIKFDMAFMLKYLGMNPDELVALNTKLIETKYLARLYDSDRNIYTLGSLAVDLLNYTSWKSTLHDWNDYYKANMPNATYSVNSTIVKEFVNYAGLDALITYELYKFLYDKLITTNSKTLIESDMIIEPALLQIIMHGDRIDDKALEQFGTSITNELAEIDDKLRAIIAAYSGQEVAADFNLNSGAQLAHFCVTYLGFSKALKNKKFVTSTKQLSLTADTIPALIESYAVTGSDGEIFLSLLAARRKLEKQYSSYYLSYKQILNNTTPDENGMYFIHPSIDTAGTVTGRVATSTPNTQQLPRDGFVRRLFTSRYDDGYILSMDYSQAEVRMLALATQDTKLLDTFEHKLDPYKTLATVVFSKKYEDVTKAERNMCKPLMLAALYGMSPKSLAPKIDTTIEDAKRKYNLFMRDFKGIRQYHKFLEELAVKYGYVYGPTYRKRNFGLLERALADGEPELKIRELSRGVYTKMINAPIQGATSDMALYNFSRLARAVVEAGLEATWMLTVHDSIVFDVASLEVAEAIVNLAKTILPELHPATIKYMNDHWKQWRSVYMAFDAEIGRNYGKYNEHDNPNGVKDINEVLGKCLIE